MDHTMKKAMHAVVADMGMAARRAKAKRFQPKHDVEVSMGEVKMEPTDETHIDPVKQAEHLGDADMTQQEMDELMAGMQR